MTAANACHSVSHLGGAYGCRADVTSTVVANRTTSSGFNGVYTVGGVQGQVGTVDNTCQCIDVWCQAKFAGWSIVIVYESASDNTQRDIFLYDGFRAIDEEQTTAGRDSFTSSGFNGVYTVGGVQGQVGTVDNTCQCIDVWCQAKFAGWSIVIVYESASDNTQRDIFLYDGFRAIDEEQTTAGRDSFTISGFNVGSPPDAKLSFFALEGDRQLGIPPQDIAFGSSACPDGSCVDSVEYNGSPLSNSFNAPGNVYNGTVPGGFAVGVDLDTYDISTLVSTGDSSATISIVSGDGTFNNSPFDTHGWGEYLIVNWLLMRINRLAPNFAADKTRLDVVPSEVAPGGTVFFTLTLTNQGSMTATNVVVRDVLPAGLEYVPGTTRVDGVLKPDVGGTSPLFAGLNLGSVPYFGDNDRRITYEVRVIASTPPGTIIVDSATINATELESPVETNSVTITVVGANLNTPTKIDKDLNGGNATPGDIVEYEVFISKSGTLAVGGLSFKDTISPYVQLIELPTGVGDNSNSSLTGGSNGTGYIEVNDISIGDNQTGVYLRYKVRILTSAEIVAKGVDPANVNGLSITNQGSVNAAFLPGAKVTDDPALPGANDPTTFQLRTGVDFTGATTNKAAVDVNGGLLQPGDVIEFTLTFRNNGAESGTINILDNIPAFIESVSVVTPRPEVAFVPPTAGANGTGLLIVSNLIVGPAAQVVVRFRGTVAAAAPNGTTITNVAQMSVTEDPGQNRNLSTTPLTVSNAPDLSNTTKTVVNMTAPGGFQPGETVRYTIAIRNDGTLTATSVVVTDVVDTALTGVVVEDGGVFDAGSGAISWTLGTIAAGAVTSVHFRAVIGPIANINVSNQAIVLTDGGLAFLSDDPAVPGDDNPTVFRVTAQPDLSNLTKAFSDENGGTIKPGDTMLYTLTFSNTGRTPATNTVLSDVVDAAFASVTPLDGGVYTAGTRTVTWNVGAVPINASKTLRFRATLASTLAPSTVVRNQASVLSTELIAPVLSDDPNTLAVDDPTSFTVISAANLSTSTKTASDINGGNVQPGDQILYTLTLNNTGDAPATNVVLTDVVDLNLVNIAVQDGGFFNSGNRTITWSIPATLTPGTPVTVHFQAQVAPGLSSGTVISNQGAIAGTGVPANTVTDDPSTPAPSDPTRLTIVSQPDFVNSTKAVANLSGATVFVPGDRVRYTLVVQNSGSADATLVSVVDPVPAQLSNVTVANGGAVSGGSVRWTLPLLRAGEQTTLTFEGQIVTPIADGTVVQNQANITSPQSLTPTPTDDPSTPALDDPTNFTVTSKPNFDGASKVFTDVNAGSIEAGDVIEYTIAFTNEGSDSGRNMVVSDQVDPNLTNVVPQNGGVYDATTRTIVWSFGTDPRLLNVAPGSTIELRFRATIVATIANLTRINNQAQLRSLEVTTPVLTDDPTTPTVDDPTGFFVISAANLTDATKTVAGVGAGSYRPGDTVTYTITFSNTGSDAASGVTVTDVVANTLTNVVPQNLGTFNATNRTITWNVGAVAIGETINVRFTAQIVDALPNGTTIANQAQLNSPGFGSAVPTDDPATPAVDDPTVLTVTSAPRFTTSTKTATDVDGDGFYEPGDQVRYTISVRNDGDAPGTSVTLTDTVDTTRLTNITVQEGGTLSGSTLTWTLPSLAAGSQFDVHFIGQIGATVGNGVAIANQSTIQDAGGNTAVTDDPTTPTADDPTIIRVTASPRISVHSKAVLDLNGGQVLGGDSLRYTITVTNAGSQAATSMVIVDPLDATLFNVSVTDPRATVSAAEITWTIGTLPAGTTETLVFTAEIPPGTVDGTRISNQARIIGDGGINFVTDDPATTAVDDTTVVVVNAQPDLSTTTKTVRNLTGGALNKPGDTLEYTITVTNTGFANAAVTVEDDISTRLTNVALQNGGTLTGNRGKWTPTTTPSLAALAPGAFVNLVYTAQIGAAVPNGTVIPNQAILSIAAGTTWLSDDPGTTALDDPTNLTVRFPALASFTKSVVDVDGGQVKPGDQLRYTLVITAANQEAVSQLVVTDAIDPNLTVETVLNGGVVDATGAIIWNAGTTPALGTLAAGGSITLEFLARVGAAVPNNTVIRNQAKVQAADGISLDSNVATITVNAINGPDFNNTTKTYTDLNGGTPTPGDIIEYTLSFTNEGGEASTDAMAFDSVPLQTTYVAGTTTLNGTVVGDDGNGLSALVGGLRLSSAGAAPGTVRVGDTVRVSFRVQVNGNATGLVRNQARANAGGMSWLSDDPNTAAPDDETVFFVGSGPGLGVPNKSVTINDDNGNGQADIGEDLVYTVSVTNVSSQVVTGVYLSDAIPAGTDYVVGFLSLNGRPLTEADDADEGRVSVTLIEVAVGAMAPGETATVSFHLEAFEEGVVVNAAKVEAISVSSQASNPVTTIIGAGSQVYRVRKAQPVDLNGGLPLLGEDLRYVIEVENLGNQALLGVTVDDAFPVGLSKPRVELTPSGAAVEFTPGGLTVSGFDVAVGATATIQFLATLDPTTARDGLELCNGATALVGTQLESSDFTSCVTPGRTPGVVQMGGLVVHDRNDDQVLQDSDKRLPNYRVEAVDRITPSLVLASATTDKNGEFALNVPVGEYYLRYYSERGVQMGRYPADGYLTATEGTLPLDATIFVDPQGIVFNSQTAAPLTGVQLFAYYDDDDPYRAGELVAPEGLSPEGLNQQGQLTSADGFYQFFFDPTERGARPVDAQRAYRLEIKLTNSQSWQFPSVLLPPRSDLLEVGRTPILVVPNDLPDLNAEQLYYLRFLLSGESDAEGAQNNHIPLDPIQSLISLDKRVDKPTASIGDVLTYKVTVQNRSDRDIIFDPAGDATAAFNGVFIQDELPSAATLRYAPDSARAKLIKGDKVTDLEVALDKGGATTGESILRFGHPFGNDVVGLDLPAGGRLELTYNTIVGIKAQPNTTYTNIATAFGTGNVRLTDSDTADVRVVADPIFDQGVIFGKVFCDPNANGYQDAGEEGVYHAKLMLDTGYWAATDEYGKYHFHDIDPGSHLIKLDTTSLPLGGTLTTAESRVFYMTRGLPTKTNFGVECPVANIVDDVDVLVGDATARKVADEFAARFINVKGDLNLWTTEVAGTSFDLMRPSAYVSLGEATPAPPAEGVVVQLEGGAFAQPLVFTLGMSKGPAPSRWKLSVARKTELAETTPGELVREFEGDGLPPATLEWNGTSSSGSTLAVDGGQNYEFWLDVIGGDDEFGRSARGIFLVAGVDESVIEEVTIDSLGGALFDKNNKPTKTLKSALTLQSMLLSLPPKDAKVIVEVHVDDELAPYEAFDLTDQQAKSLRNYLKARGLMGDEGEVVAKGSDVPFLPNLDEESRQQNRRVVIKQVGTGKSSGADKVGTVERVKSRAIINDYSVPFTDGDFDVLVPRPVDGLLVVDIQDASGARAIKAVEVKPAPNDQGVQVDPFDRTFDQGDTKLPLVPASFVPGQAYLTIAQAPAPLTLHDVALQMEQKSFTAAAGALSPNAKFDFVLPAGLPVRAWSLEVRYQSSGELVYRVSDDGEVPPMLRWSGATKDGVLLSGIYEAQLTVMGAGASRAVSPPTAFAVNDPKGTPLEVPAPSAQAPSLHINGREILLAVDGRFQFNVEGFTGEAFLADLRLADGSRILEVFEIPAGYERNKAPELPAVDVTPAITPTDVAPTDGAPTDGAPTDGATVTPTDPPPTDVAPTDGATEPTEKPLVDPFEEPLVDPFEQDSGDQIDGSLLAPTGRQLAVLSRPVSPDSVRRSSSAIRAVAPEELSVTDDEGFRPLRGHRIGLGNDTRVPRVRVLLAQEVDPFETTPMEVVLPAADGATEAVDGVEGTIPGPDGEVGADATRATVPDSDVESRVAGTMSKAELDNLAKFGASPLNQAFTAEGIIDLEALKRAARAANLKVALPLADMKLPNDELVVNGVTDPANQLAVNGKTVEVKENGSFETVVKLPDGPSTLVIETLDPDGNQGRIEWPVQVEPTRYFLMAFADSAVANTAANLAGANDHNSTTVGSGLMLYGQARLYFKGHMKGSELGTEFFEAFDSTVHIDTGKKAEFEEMFSTLIQPEEYYPVYGDAAEENHEVNARGKLYLVLDADESHLKVANFRADMKGIQFFDYARAFYGLDVEFDKTLAENYDTDARIFVAGDSFLGDGSPKLRHTYNYLRGTGGSLYYLEHDHIVEGSEQLFLVVKDRITGAVLSRVPQTNNVDYTLRYAEGRILFKSPVSSVADDSMMTGGELDTRSTMDGNPVFIEVGYEYEADDDAGSTTWGGQLRETFYDQVEVGVGYVEEGRGGALAGNDYQLFGADLAYRYSPETFAEVEYARSRSFDTLAVLSEDGGLSFDKVQRRDGVDDIGNAYHVAGRVELADLTETERARLAHLSAFYDDADEGFYSNRNALERGSQKFGGEVAWDVDASNVVGYRNDSVLSRVDDLVDPNPDALKTMARYVNRLYYDYTSPVHSAGAEYNYSFADDYFAEDGYGMHTAAVKYRYTGIDKLSLGISQEGVLSADDRRLVRQTSDRLTTGFTAAWQIFDELALEATEKVRWNGENSTRLGLRSQVAEGTSTYVQQRIGTREGGTRMTTSTVVGGEQRFGDGGSGRAFGEYQLEGGVSAQRNRAIAGLGKRWELGKGVNIDTAYERTQIFGKGSYGDSSRDVVSLGFELTRYKSVKASSRFEFRYDQGDPMTPQFNPCLTNGILDTPEFCQDLQKGGFDKYQLVTLNTIDWKWNENLTMLIRYNIAMTQNLTLDTLEQIDQELSFGMALRPVDYDVVNALMKYTYLDSQRPLALEAYTYDRTQKHIISLVPVFELPWDLQLVNKLAWKHVITDFSTLGEEESHGIVTDTLMYILRLNYHLWHMTEELTLDLASEYRLLQQFDPRSFEHGVLLEADVVLMDHVRMGVGYNFTSFTDNEYAPEGEDSHGWFFRVQGTY
ncbi:MAG: hypothetical protein AUK47_29115 [Deltaproteobacteria bacterium CG2_30_63_29]|nr:MAG: hypothetical protein AUK47_29115 [Deltaproteobacteria bacterium CG2_30_63_29]